MTAAVCFRCGAIKFGAFCPCQDCDAMPRTDEEFALSMVMTDHYFDMDTLVRMGAAVRDGSPPQLNAEDRDRLVAQLRDTGVLAELQDR